MTMPGTPPGTGPGRHRLAVDLGTSTTIAMMQWPDGRVRPLLFDGSPLLSSAVLLGVDGQVHTGRDATHLGRGNPERLEPNPKRRIDDDLVLLGTAEVPVRDLLGAVLGRVAVEAHRVAGRLGDLTLTHPAAWGARRSGLLLEAAERAGLGRGRLVAEPVAAAMYFAHTMIDSFPPGSRLVVYDLGAGTCDITVLRRAPHGFDIVASDGLNDVGGLDIDAAIVAFLEATYGRLWTDAVSRRHVWDEVRNAKEMLSRSSGTVIAIPSLGKEAPLGREQFDGLIGPVLRPTIALAKSLLRDTAGAAAPGAPTGIVLVGGASRVPLVATMLAEATGIPPIVIEQPELVVAEGALHLGGQPGGAAVGSPAGGTFGPTGPVPVSGGPVPVSGGPVPVSGAGPAWSGSTSTAMPASGPGGPSMPVSGVSGPAGPVTGGPWASGEYTPAAGLASSRPMPAGGFAPPGGQSPGGQSPGGFGPGPAPGGFGPHRPPARSGGRSTGLILGIVAAALVLLIAVPVTVGYVLLKDDEPGGSGGNRPSPNAGSGPARTGGPGGGSGAAKYKQTALPENLCATVDLGRLATTYDDETATPVHQRTLGTTVSSGFCTIQRQRTSPNIVMSISITAFIYADPAQAVTAQKQVLDSAKLNDPNVVTLSGIGDEAFANRVTQASSASDLLASYAVEARDGNLKWTVYGTAAKVSGSGWTDRERSDLVNDLAAMVKNSIAKMGTG